MNKSELLWILLLLILISGCKSTEAYVPWWVNNDKISVK